LKAIDRKLDTAWAKLVKLRSGNVCEYCGTPRYIQSHHIFGRHNTATRWLPSNGVCLCIEHHTASGSFSAHLTIAKFIKWLEITKGVEFVDLLRLESNKAAHFSDHEKRELLEMLNHEIKELK
jgi:predicted glycosyltransferase